MTLTREEIAAFIVQRDRAFRRVIDQAGPPPPRRAARVDERFAYLVRSIVFQLLATSAATTIHSRVEAACEDGVTVQSILDAGVATLKDAGLSRTKAEAMVDLAQHVASERIHLQRHGRMSNEAVLQEVTRVRGIGPWTAHMYLMHTLARRDVWPVGDYGVRNGWSIVHGLDTIISEKDLATKGERFPGVQSDVAWYCWQAVHFVRDAK